jgi:organic radical activating enzyme
MSVEFNEDQTIHPIHSFITMQGEGPDAGRRMMLIRFKECDRVANGHPCEYCDTLVTMSISNKMSLTLQDLQTTLYNTKCGIMITGGEPGYSNNYNESLLMLNELIYPYANVETNGCNLTSFIKDTQEDNIKFIYSPKIFSSEELKTNLELSEAVLKDKRVYFKIVYENNDLIHQYLEELIRINNGNTEHIYLMPEGDTIEKLIKHSGEVFDMCEKYKVNFSTRSHIIYGFI